MDAVDEGRIVLDLQRRHPTCSLLSRLNSKGRVNCMSALLPNNEAQSSGKVRTKGWKTIDAELLQRRSTTLAAKVISVARSLWTRTQGICARIAEWISTWKIAGAAGLQ
jgi:hypothetical protein